MHHDVDHTLFSELRRDTIAPSTSLGLVRSPACSGARDVSLW
jgi:hypothetical protein